MARIIEILILFRANRLDKNISIRTWDFTRDDNDPYRLNPTDMRVLLHLALELLNINMNSHTQSVHE